MNRHFYSRWLPLLLSVSLALPAFGQQSDSVRINDLEKKLEQSLKIIEQLNERVNQLENQRVPERAVATSVTKPAPAAEQRLTEVERKVTEIAEGAGKSSEDRGILLHGFADVGVGKAGKGAGDNRANGFSLGTLSFYQIGRAHV